MCSQSQARRVLLIGADPDVLAGAEAMVRQAGVREVRKTALAEEAAWCFAKQSLDLVIVDEAGVAGVDAFLDELTRRPLANARTPVILLLEKPTLAQVRRRTTQVQAILSKPVNKDALLRRVFHLLNRAPPGVPDAPAPAEMIWRAAEA